MKKIIVSLVLSSLSLIAGVTRAEDHIIVSIQNNDQVLMDVRGEAAQTLFNSLNVEAISSFGMVQTMTKTTEKVQCTEAILGDVRGSMSKPSYSCSILVDRK